MATGNEIGQARLMRANKNRKGVAPLSRESFPIERGKGWGGLNSYQYSNVSDNAIALQLKCG